MIAKFRRLLGEPVVRQVLKFAVTLGLLGLLAAKADLHAVADRIRTIGIGSCALCVLVTLGLSMLVALRWGAILRLMRAPTAFAQCWRLVMIGLFFNQILPSGMGGDAVRVWLLARGGSRLRTAFLSVAADRIFALSAIVFCMVAFLPLLLRGPAGEVAAVLSFGGAVSIAVLLMLDRFLAWVALLVPRRLYQLAEQRAGRVLDVLRELAAVLRLVLRSWPDGMVVFGISVVSQLVLGWIIYFIARRLHVEVGLVTVIALFSPAFLLSMMPISLGGWGVREAALVWLLGTVHVPQDAALAISLLFGLVTTAAGLPGGLLWLFERRGAALRETISLVAEEELSAPRVLSRSKKNISPWVSVMERTVDFGGGRVEVYHAIDQADYVAILAVTPDFQLPIVRQYRPALERYTWELPAGMVDAGENPLDTCVRELREETGLETLRIHPLGVHAADSARMGNRVHSFLVEANELGAGSVPEAGIDVAYVSLEQLRAMIISGEFDLQYHVAALGLALMRPGLAKLLGPAAQGSADVRCAAPPPNDGLGSPAVA
jgi:uncharacterized protein (TIRG00374 family)